MVNRKRKNKKNPAREGSWGFLIPNTQIENPSKNIEKYALIGPRKGCNVDYDERLMKLVDDTTKRCMRGGPPEEYDINTSSQLIGIPLKKDVRNNFRDYAKKSLDFLFSNLKGIDDRPEIIVPKEGKNYTNNASGNMFLADGLFKYIIVDITHPRIGGSSEKVEKFIQVTGLKYS